MFPVHSVSQSFSDGQADRVGPPEADFAPFKSWWMVVLAELNSSSPSHIYDGPHVLRAARRSRYKTRGGGRKSQGVSGKDGAIVTFIGGAL